MVDRITSCGCRVPKGQKCIHEQARVTARQKANDEQRGTPAQRGYDKEWSKLRFRFLHHNPTCCVCGAPGKHVDHIVSVRDAPDRRLDPTNLRTLCHSCHSRRTARDQSANWGR